MLRVRVVSPAGLTGPLVERLTAAHGVQNLVVLREAVRRPQGDAVHFDLSDGAANPVFREVRERGRGLAGAAAAECGPADRGRRRGPVHAAADLAAPAAGDQRASRLAAPGAARGWCGVTPAGW
jgi:hypothetical protein